MMNIDERQIGQFSRNRVLQELLKRNLSTNGDFAILRNRLMHNCRKNGRESIQQPFDFLAVVDFEATCVAKPPVPPNVYIQEIIEFPVVLVDVAQQTIVDKFHSYCRPVLQPLLSDYCKRLTGITQEQVNNAPLFVDVFANVEKWLNDRDLLTNAKRKCLFVTDSRSDFNKYLHMQCEISQIIYPKWANQWINIKLTFTEFYSIDSGRIHDMLEKLGLPFVGSLHSGLDDATNIATVVIALLKDGCVLVPNEFFVSSMVALRQNTSVSTTSLNYSRMVCLNCSKCHAEMQGSCVQRLAYRRQQSRSPSPRVPSNQSISTANIPSLLDLPLHYSRSSRLSDEDNDMNCS